MPRAIAEVDADLGALKGQVAGLETRIAVLDIGGKGIEKAIANLQTSLDRQNRTLDELRAAISEYDKRFHSLTLRLETVESSLKATESTMQSHISEFTAFKPRFDRLSTDLEKWGSRLWAVFLAFVMLFGTATLAYVGLKK